MLPPDERIGCVAPGLGLLSAGVPAKVLGSLHLREYVERRAVVRVRFLGVPSLARNPVLGHAHVPLVETATSFDARS